ncbi:MAG: hypothetical protein P4L10_13875 [Acidobacteriaceae bacterium]|nr:hypothetical protein [Acidobacteriaceae bacterium]
MRELNGENIVYDKKTKDFKTVMKGEKVGERKEDDGLFVEENVGAGDKFGAVLPFLGALVEPGKHPPAVAAEPEENYKLEYVYGFRTYDCRQNAFFTANDKVVYNVAALGVVLDVRTNTQSFFGGGQVMKGSPGMQHTDDIICLSLSPDRRFAATGQVGAQPTLYVWDTETCKVKSNVSYAKLGKNTRGISSCSWSVDGKYVAFVDRSDKRTVYVLDVDAGKLVFNQPGTASEVFDMAWSKQPGSYIFATCGSKHINFWDFKNSPSPRAGTGHGAQTFSCVTFDDKGTCYAGGANGKVYVFKGNSKAGEFVAHTGMIHSINWVDGKLLTGGADRVLCVWEDLKKVDAIKMDDIPRALDKRGDSILAGLRNGTVAIVSGGKVASEVMHSHHEGEIWGLDVIEEKGEILTTCDDNKIMRWNVKDRKNNGIYKFTTKVERRKMGASTMSKYPDSQCMRAICYNAKTSEVAIANNYGSVQIRALDKLDVAIHELEVCNRWIEFMCYSPNGNYLAVGGHDNVITIFQVPSYTPKGKLTAHKSSILSIDWSKDSKYIRSNCEAYELLFFDIDSMTQMTSGASATKDVEWNSQYTKIGWSVQGVFPPGTDGSHVNGVCMSADGKLIATGDDWGLLNIYRNPCLKGSKAKSYKYDLLSG